MIELSNQEISDRIRAAGLSERHVGRFWELHNLFSVPAPISATQLLRVWIKKDFGLHNHMPERLNDNINASAILPGMSRQELIAATLEHGPICCYGSTTLESKIKGIAHLLGTTQRKAASILLKDPALTSFTLETLSEHIARNSELLGLSRKELLELAKEGPALLRQGPEKLARRKPYLQALTEACGETRSFLQLLSTYPRSITYSEAHLHVRYVIAKLQLKPWGFSRLLTRSKEDAEQLVIDHYTAQIEMTGKGKRTLQVMHAKGLISRLPEGIPAIPRPLARDAQLEQLAA